MIAELYGNIEPHAVHAAREHAAPPPASERFPLLSPDSGHSTLRDSGELDGEPETLLQDADTMNRMLNARRNRRLRNSQPPLMEVIILRHSLTFLRSFFLK